MASNTDICVTWLIWLLMSCQAFFLRYHLFFCDPFLAPHSVDPSSPCCAAIKQPAMAQKLLKSETVNVWVTFQVVHMWPCAKWLKTAFYSYLVISVISHSHRLHLCDICMVFLQRKIRPVYFTFCIQLWGNRECHLPGKCVRREELALMCDQITSSCEGRVLRPSPVDTYDHTIVKTQDVFP